MITFGCFIDHLQLGGGGLLSETPVRVDCSLKYLHIYFEISLSGCRSWNSLTLCPFYLWQPYKIYIVVFRSFAFYVVKK